MSDVTKFTKTDNRDVLLYLDLSISYVHSAIMRIGEIGGDDCIEQNAIIMCMLKNYMDGLDLIAEDMKKDNPALPLYKDARFDYL